MDLDYAALATAAATAVVTAMAREGWDGVRSAVARLWRRGRPEQVAQVEAALEQSRQELVSSEESLANLTETELVAEWQAKLRRLLAAEPEVADELTEILGLQAQRGTGVKFGPVTHLGLGDVYQAGRDIYGGHSSRQRDV